MIEDTLRYLVENSLLGILPPDYFLSPEMAAWTGGRAASNGKEFENRVFVRIKQLGLNARASVLMSELGVPADRADLRQSDVDVLAWNADTGTILVIECKRLKLARTIGEIADQLNDFRNETDPQGKNKLARHQERAEWLVANRAELSRITGIMATRMTLKPLIVTDRTVPMQFSASLPAITTAVMNYDQLSVLTAETRRR